MSELTPEDVFTPARPVREDMFATRRHKRLQERVQAGFLEQGRQIVVYGPTGVGKTSLINFICHQRNVAMVRVECGGTFEEMMRDVLAKTLEEDEVERVVTVGGEAELSASLWTFLSARAKASTERQVKTVKLPRSLGGLVAEALALNGIKVLFLDNFENLDGKKHGTETARAVAELLKLFSDRSAESDDDVKIVVAGIPDASERLIAMDPATARRTSQIEVERMPEDELDQILLQGGAKLDIEFEGFGRSQIIQASDGFPYYTHLFGLHCARRVRRLGVHEVRLDDFEAALDDILADCHLELRRAYEKAVETTGDVKTRKTIMEAVANASELEIPFRRIREGFLVLHPDRYESVSQLNFLTTHIGELKEMGILDDRDLPKSPNNLYRFRDPLMRAYVRLRGRRETRPTLV